MPSRRSMWSAWSRESVSRRMEASGGLELAHLRWSGGAGSFVELRRPGRLSSRRAPDAHQVYSPLPALCVDAPPRNWADTPGEGLEEDHPHHTSDTIQMTMEIKRRLVWIPGAKARPCSASYS